MTFNRTLLTVSEIVLLTGLARSTVFLAIRDGKLAATKLSGRRRRVTVADLEAYLGQPVNLPSAQQ
jgi:excisionase family DNA binding protein